MEHDLLNGLALLLVLGCLIATFYGPWQWYCIEKSRQALFEIRAEIFNIAASGGLSFESIEYRAIRESINLRLRFAHRVCWQQLLLLAIFHPKLPPESKFGEQIAQIGNKKVQNYLRTAEERVNKTLAYLVICRSPFLLLAYVVVLLIAKARSDVGEQASSSWISAGRRASIEAENVGPALDRWAAAA